MNEISLIHQILQPIHSDFVMIDVGAHYGGSLKYFAGDGATVYAFEPDIDNRKKLLNSISHKNYNSRITIDGRAVTNKDYETKTFFRSEISSGISGLSKFHDSHKPTYEVETISLTTFCKEKNITNVDFLKIDTEGFDLFVLEGFNWDKYTPECIICEFEDNKTHRLGYNWKDISEFLSKIGYHILVSEWEPIIKYGIQHQWSSLKKYPTCLKSNDAWGNILAFRKKNHFELFIDKTTKQ